jgi:hypothetical protein
MTRQIIGLLFVLLLVACGPDEPVTVTYLASGSATELNVSYTSSSGNQVSEDKIKSPWQTSAVLRSGETAEVQVQPVSGDGSGVCEIEVDGRTVDTKMVMSLTDTASCTYKIP